MSMSGWFGAKKPKAQDRGVAAILDNDQSAPPVDTRGAMHWGFLALLLGGIGFFVWAAVAPLSQGVPVQGYVKVEGNSKAVQHLRGGIVEEILVREGDRVKAGQPLLRLNETQLKAQLGIVESQLISALATEARLLAERSGKGQVEFPEFLLERKDHPLVIEAMDTQRQLFGTRRAALRGEEAIGRENISGLEQQVRGMESQEQAKTRQLKLFNDELDALRPLYEQGYVPRNRMFELERSVAYLSGQRSEDMANIGRARSQISEIQLKIHQSREVYQKEVETQLTETQRLVGDLRERYVATQDDLSRAVVRSPANGTVVGLTMFTVGGVAAPGQKLMDVVPEGRTLQIEAQIPTQLIDNVKPGLAADIRFSALDRFDVAHIAGRLVYVSADRMTDPVTNQAYFLGRVEVTPEGMRMLAGHELLPGMPADVVIITGERTLLGYLIHPLVSRLHFAFTER